MQSAAQQAVGRRTLSNLLFPTYYFPSTRRSFSAPKTDRIGGFAQLVEASGLKKDAGIKDILTAVWKNEVITSQCPNLVIRLTSLRGEVSKRLWEQRGNNPEDIQILAVGTVAAPTHIKNYTGFLNNFFVNSAKLAQEEAKSHSRVGDFVIGYDLLSKGGDEARSNVLKYFNQHYNLSDASLEKTFQNSAITAGGMRGLKDLADALVLWAKDNGKPHRFIQPDNSFGTWFNIIEKPVKNDAYRREIHTLTTLQKDRLHLTPQHVNEFYSKNGVTDHDSWYITHVGNPSGTKMTAQQLAETCHAIVKHNPKAVIILDSVYVRTLTHSDAKDLLKEVVNSPKLLDNIIFLESFSKSHGLCGERLGMYFSTNEKLFTQLHTANIAYSAGPGRYKDHQIMALSSPSKQDLQGVEDLHFFWMKERKGLYNYLMSKNKTIPLFEVNQDHITPADMDQPCTLYILLKSKEGVKAADVFMSTGVLGVDTPLGSGHYIRFAVGTLTKPVYSQYA